jgi:signal transduction histidine kinase/CheY-like chemotaxis protein
MRRLAPWDRALLLGVVALWGACFAAALYAALGPGLHEIPLQASDAPGPDGYPAITELPPPAHAPVLEARAGDRVLRAGGVDLRGASGLRTLLHAFSEMDAAGSLRLLVDRGGEPREVEIRTVSVAYWFLFATGVGFAAAGTLAFLGGGSAPAPRFFFLACLAAAFHTTWFHGGSPARTLASIASYALGGTLVGPFAVLTLLHFPAETARRGRAARLWPWLFALGGIGATGFTFGWPVRGASARALAMGGNIALATTLLALLAASYRRAGALGRRQLRWVAIGLAVGLVPLLAASLVLLSRPELMPVLVLSNAFLLAIPAGFLVAIVYYRAFDLERVVGAAVTYGATLLFLLAAVAIAAPLVTERLAAGTGAPPESAHLAIALAAGLAIAPVSRRLRPRVERFFFPERHALAAAVSRLGDALDDCTDERETASVLGERLDGLLQPERCLVYEAREAELALVFASGDCSGAADAAQLRALAAAGRVLSFEEGGAGAVAEERALLRKAGLAVLAPVRRGDELALVVCLGPKRSEDVYAPADLAHLRAVTERAGVALLRARAIELRRSSAQERAANLAKSRFLAAASHDLRQPLHALGLFVGALAERARGPEIEPLVARIARATASLEELFDGVLDVSKLDAGVVEPRVRDFALAELFDALREELGPQARARGLLLRVVPTGAAVRSDPLLLARILRNLLLNALRYTGAGGVMLCARRRGDALALEVRDSGPGLSAAEQREIFEEFRRGRLADRAPEGLGLGLSIVERLAGLLGHRLELRSAPGRGSVFSVCVPRADSAAGIQGTPPPSADRLRGKLVAVVDDEPAILEAMRALLTSWGCRTATFASGRELVAGLALGAPDVIVADLGLAGGETGAAAIEAARRALGAHVPAAVITGDTAPAHLAAVEALGIPVLSKPIAAARLRALLAQLLRDA